jgi:hypothetical protein
MTTVTLNLPDTLAAEANAAGLLSPEAVEQMLREGLRRKAIEGLFAAADKLAAANFAPMTMQEIQDEVNAVRAERKHRTTGA